MSRKKKPVDGTTLKENARQKAWHTLRELIAEYKEAAIGESWKGGGDPLDIPVLEAQLTLAEMKLHCHIEQMKREEGDGA